MTRPTCLTRLALRRALTWENVIIAGMVLGTAACVAVSVFVGLAVWRLA